MMTTVYTLRYLVLGMLALAGSWGCAATQEPGALTQARNTYMQAQQNQEITTQAALALYQAEQSLRQAEQLWANEQDVAGVQHLAYVTERRVEIARATTEQKQAESDVQKLGEEREQVLLSARTREAQQAVTRATRFEQELSELKARQTDRGLVLTLGDVLFESGRAELKPGTMRSLFPLVSFLNENPGRKMSVEGHTDSVGSESYNLDLSQRRAESVLRFLRAQGIDAGRMTAIGYGEAYPVASNDSEAGRQQNRRVEVVVQ